MDISDQGTVEQRFRLRPELITGFSMELKGLIREALIKMILGFDIALEIEEE